MSGSLRAYGTEYWDYFLTDKGVVRINLIPPLAFAAILIFWVAALTVLLLVGNAPWDLLNPVSIAGIFASFILTQGIYRVLSGRSRRKLSSFTSEQIARSSKPIPWSSVESFSLNGRILTLRIDGTNYKMTVKESDPDAVRQYLQPRLGGKPQGKEPPPSRGSSSQGEWASVNRRSC